MTENNSNPSDTELPKLEAVIQGLTEWDCLKRYCELILLIAEKKASGLNAEAESLFGSLASGAKLSLASMQISPRSAMTAHKE